MTSFSTGGYKDLCSAQVSNEQPSCCQSLALTSYLGRALIKGLAGKCMLQVLFRAVKMSRAGLIKLALTTSISLFYFKFHNLIWFLWFFFFCALKIFSRSMNFLCNVNFVQWHCWVPDISVLCLCPHAHRKAEKEVSIWSLPQMEDTIKTQSWSIVSLCLQTHPSELRYIPPSSF